MVKEKEALIANILKAADAMVVMLSFLLAYFIDHFIRSFYDFTGMAFAEEATLKGLIFFSEKNIVLTISFVPVWLLLLNLFGAYKDIRTRAFYKDLAIIIKSSLLAIIVFGSIVFITKMDEHDMYGKEVEGYRVLGRIQDIPFILHRKVIDRVIFVIPRLWLHRIDEVILACEREGIATSISLDLYDLRIAEMRQTNFSGFPLLEFETFGAKEWQLFIKRFADIILSLFFIIILSPILIITAIVIKLETKGPILFNQIRSGVNGRKFKLYKFRSMVVGAEMKKKHMEKMNEMDGPVFKIKHDPRITKVGRFIRKLSIDELPQLINVLKGDMSIVGPRPPLPVEVQMYELWQRRRLSLKPGLTCIWQVSGRNHINFERWMEMDLEYIDNWSLWMDFKILFKTFFVVAFGYGAS